MILQIWQVTYDTVFESSSGMRRYSNTNPGHYELIATYGDSLHDIAEVINRSLDSQSRLGKIHKAVWLGEALATYTMIYKDEVTTPTP